MMLTHAKTPVFLVLGKINRDGIVRPIRQFNVAAYHIWCVNLNAGAGDQHHGSASLALPTFDSNTGLPSDLRTAPARRKLGRA